VFVNSTTSEIRIGDLGLATMIKGGTTHSVLGTPEFMAPEMFGESYSHEVDIYAFGMMLLEIATAEAPFNECENQCQVMKKVMEGTKPLSLDLILD